MNEAPQDSYTARVLPVAKLTWELRERLDGDVQETARLPLQFPGPIEILGLHASISLAEAAAGGGLVSATLDDVLILLDANQQERITSAVGRNTLGVNQGGSFVTASALNTSERWLRWVIANDQPDLGVKFRWKPDVATPIFEDAIVSLAFFFRFLKGHS